jgi:hypothetical protein
MAGRGQSSFTPTSVLAPIKRVYLATPKGDEAKRIDLYTCGGTAEACAVDLADQAALDALFAKAVAVPVGTYETVGFELVEPKMRVKGTVQLTKRADPMLPDPVSTPYTFRTVSGADVLSDSAGAPEYAELPVSNIPESVLPRRLEVRAGDAIDLSALFTLRDVAWGFSSQEGETSWGNCRRGPNQTGLCIALPALAVFPATEKVTVEAYLISERMGPMSDATTVGEMRAFAGAQILFIVGADGEPISGWMRSYYSETSKRPNSIYHSRLRFVRRNASPPDAGVTPADAGDDAGASDAGPDAATSFPPLAAGAVAYELQDFGYQQPEDDPDTTRFRLRMAGFYRADHRGQMIQEGTGTAVYYAFARQ